MLNQLLLGPHGKSISNEGESTEIGCQEYKITIWVGYLDKKGPWCYLGDWARKVEVRFFNTAEGGRP